MAKKPKISTAGGRHLRIDITHASKKKNKHVDADSKRDMDRLIIVQGSSENTGRRLGRVDSLNKLSQQAKDRSSVKIRSKEEKSLQKFGRGMTKGKQKAKGTSKPPVAHSKTSQAHIDVFYAGSNKKWDIVPQIDPLKTCRVK